jgi:hypothetical protein
MEIRRSPFAVRRSPIAVCRSRSAGGRRRTALLTLAATLALALPACESTQDKSARLEREGGGAALREKGVVVTRQNGDVKVVATDVIQDENGTAAVVRLRNESGRALAQVPITIDVRGAGDKRLFRNDDPGLEPTLVKAPLLGARREFTWVNDQVAAAARPRSLEAKVGEAQAVGKGVPKITVTRPRLEQDPVSGVSAVGFAANRSRVEQRKLVIFAVARKGNRVVAAGRGQINRLKAGRRARYTVFFIGNPRGARISVAAPPTRLR